MNTSQITIRGVSIKDLNQLANIFDSYRVWYKKGTDVEGAAKFLEERIMNQDSEIFVAELDGKIIGFTHLYPLFSSVRMRKLWLLNDLFVDERYRGRGVSLLLINRAKQLVKDTKACAMFLETDKTNTIGNQLYPRAGFELNVHSNYYEWEAE